jgi:L-lactate utilization protein LutC
MMKTIAIRLLLLFILLGVLQQNGFAQQKNDFVGFIGSSFETADTEQALVLGAHRPLSMTVFIINE